MDNEQVMAQEGAKLPVKKRRGISGSTVKIIAVITMFIDHAGAVVLARALVSSGYLEAARSGVLENILEWLTSNGLLFYTYQTMRMIGRLGFPIFCFLLVEGYQRTRDVRKYALRLGIFALISEIPFDLAITGNLLEFQYQNVFFTLFLGLFALCAYDFFGKPILTAVLQKVFAALGVLFLAVYTTTVLRSKYDVSDTETLAVICLVLLGVAAAALAAYGKMRGTRRALAAGADLMVLTLVMHLAGLLNTDYAGTGVLTITVMYLFRKNKILSMLAGCIVLTLMSFNEVTAFFALIPIALYNGKRGLKMKYFFYAFYPVHLFVLYLAVVWLGLAGIRLTY